MRILLTEAFNRLEGKTTSASGTFLLSQSMGGGKTHNLITMGLLAKYPKHRQQVMADFYKPGDLGAVTVVTFSGRKTSTPFGIWGDIAEQLNRKPVFNEFYSPLKPADPNKWVELLRGEPMLILLDELPPYFEAARAVAVGNTYLDRLTEIALANLLVAVNSNKLPRVCVVITDLSGTAHAGGSASITQALQSLSDLDQEVNRNVVRIDPVKINTNEIYHILRTRIFEKIPSASDIEEVAAAYGAAVDNAKKMGLPVEKMVISSNENNVLTELIHTGLYDMRNKTLIATTSPAMDILKSSNVERVLYDLFGAERTKALMAALDTEKYYQLSADELTKLQALFVADFCSGDEGKAYIKKVFEEHGYLMDPHTATCFKAYETCSEKPLKSIIYSTAEWTKFSPTIANALTGEADDRDIDALKSIAQKAKIEIPAMINGLFEKPIAQETVIEKENIEKEILSFI